MVCKVCDFDFRGLRGRGNVCKVRARSIKDVEQLVQTTCLARFLWVRGLKGFKGV